MLDTILTLVFSIVMLFFMAYPAMKITEWLIDTQKIDIKWYNVLLLSTTIILSLLIGLFLKFA